jgi:hypothetical protein
MCNRCGREVRGLHDRATLAEARAESAEWMAEQCERDSQDMRARWEAAEGEALRMAFFIRGLESRCPHSRLRLECLDCRAFALGAQNGSEETGAEPNAKPGT